MTGFRFGDFRLLPAARELWQGPQRLSLPPRAFDCLVYLVEHRDRAVGRDELIAAVWGRTEVSDAMVAQTILRIRRALGDDASAQETVRTVPRFGYRWVADTRETEAGPGHGAAGGGVPAAPAVLPAERHAGAEADAATRAPTGRRAPPVRWPVLALVATVVVLAALALWRESGRGTATTALPDAEPSAPLLVLPVLVEGSAGPPWIRLGAMDVIAEHLRRAGLAVAPSDLVVALADQWAPPGQPPDIGALFDASQARALVAPLLARTGTGWRMHLAWHERASAPVDYDAEGDGVIEAAVQAADRLLAGLGLAGGRTPPPTAADQLLAEAEAAMLSGRLAEAAALLEARPDGLAGDPALQLKLAQVRYRQGEWDRARDLIDSVLAAEPSDGLLHGRALIRQGGLLVRTAAIDEAAQAFEAALARLPERATGERGEAWNGLGVIATIRGELAAATEPLVRARALLLRSGDQLAYARTLINQGLLAMLQGQPHEGLEHYLEAEPLVLRYGAVDERVGLQVSMAFARMYLGQYATGERLAGEALALAGQTENPVVRRQAASIALRLAVLRGRGEAAAAHAAALSEAPADARFPPAIYQALLAEVHGDWRQAADSARQALDLPGLDREFRSEAARLLAGAARATGDGELAGTALAAIDALLEQQDSPRWRRQRTLIQGQAAWLAGDRDAAVRLLAPLWQEIAGQGMPIDRIEVGATLAGMHLARGESEAAAAVAGRLAPWLAEDWRVAALEEALAGEDAGRRRAARDLYRRLAGSRPPLPPW
ncbi:MAG: transcriptional regulator [Pseudoxanthomonas sp.]|nr:transcriptional regulator [Pseudoxanthomonas sp.]